MSSGKKGKAFVRKSCRYRAKLGQIVMITLKYIVYLRSPAVFSPLPGAHSHNHSRYSKYYCVFQVCVATTTRSRQVKINKCIKKVPQNLPKMSILKRWDFFQYLK